MLLDEWTSNPHTTAGVYVEMGDIDGYTEAGAVLSDDDGYRYLLWRVWDAEKPTVAYVMCNPSTGRGTANDRTLDRCTTFARNEGYGSMVVGNLFALRSKDPNALRTADDPVGPENDRFLTALGNEATTIVAAWGSAGQQFGRPAAVVEMLPAELYIIRENGDGSPQHPLYAPQDTELTRWRPEL
ncbi:DUF1643 domain-containing protein [Haloferax sp. YSMS24]|uniref:DUF1643 domain-containing protein n=1 Tax=Haloferax sp. YSMS24 TaxID=3388425 RepID=UPI00398D67C0